MSKELGVFIKVINTAEPLYNGRVGLEESGRCWEETDIER